MKIFSVEEVLILIYVMSDLHGMFDKYIEMLENIQFSDTDVLYILGDVIDRGKGSIKILQDMMLRPHIYPIVGNHELMAIKCLRWLCDEITEELIRNLDEEKTLDLVEWITNGGYNTIQELKKLSRKEKEDIIDYLMEFRAYEVVLLKDKQFLLVHAGLDHFEPNKQLCEYDINDLVWVRPDFDDSYFDDPKTYVIVGHTPTLSITKKAEIIYKNNFILIDCGACFKNGQLACLCLDTMEEFYV